MAKYDAEVIGSIETRSTVWTEFVSKLKDDATELTALREQNKELIAALEAAVAQYAGYPPEVLAEIAPEWLEQAMDALKQAGNRKV